MNKPRLFAIIHNPNWLPLVIISMALLFVTGVSLACNAPADSSDAKTTTEMDGNQALKETQVALNLEATQIALQSGLPESQTQTAQAATQITIEDQATLNAQIATQAAQPTDSPPPTNTVEVPVSEPPAAQPTTEPPAVAQPGDIDALIQDSKILLFENVTKIPLPRYIKQALDNLGLSRNYVDTKDAIGTFKAELLSGTDWDLVLVGVEARSSIEGEFFDYFNEQVNKGTGLVLEIWDLDEIAGAKATSFLSSCGVKVQSDWYDPPLTARSIWWLYGESPVFHEPNEGMSLVNYNPYWAGDAGDLLKISNGSDAVMLAGTYAQEKNSYGVLATCHENRVIIQTYSSHDYRQDDVVRLWENFIYNTLQAHFEYEAR